MVTYDKTRNVPRRWGERMLRRFVKCLYDVIP